MGFHTFSNSDLKNYVISGTLSFKFLTQALVHPLCLQDYDCFDLKTLQDSVFKSKQSKSIGKTYIGKITKFRL